MGLTESTKVVMFDDRGSDIICRTPNVIIVVVFGGFAYLFGRASRLVLVAGAVVGERP